MTLMPDRTHAVDKRNPGFLLNPHILTFSFETGRDESYRDTVARFGPLVHCCSYPMCQLNKPIQLVSQPRDFILSQPFHIVKLHKLLTITVMDYQHLIQGCSPQSFNPLLYALLTIAASFSHTHRNPTCRTVTAKWPASYRTLWVGTAAPQCSSVVLPPTTMTWRPNPPWCLANGKSPPCRIDYILSLGSDLWSMLILLQAHYISDPCGVMGL